tara:strand:+ start:167 stop:787 length:621 start_codon:yes stop_codon:yes gene_type:complete
MNQIQKIDDGFTFHQFGPVLANFKLSNKFIVELNKRGSNCHLDYKKNLAGHINNEYKFSDDDTKWFLEETKDIFSSYIKYIIFNSIHPSKKINGFKLESLWINFMKNGEFNPIHTHSGDISFVIYLSVPDEIKSEEKNFQGAGPGPGCIGFFYGEKSSSYKSEYNFIPNTGDMILFPASLRHYVTPFKSNVIRISVAGNMFFTYKT